VTYGDDMVMKVMTCGDSEHGSDNANNRGSDGDNYHSGYDGSHRIHGNGSLDGDNHFDNMSIMEIMSISVAIVSEEIIFAAIFMLKVAVMVIVTVIMIQVKVMIACQW
jgi:hypothetical protein